MASTERIPLNRLVHVVEKPFAEECTDAAVLERARYCGKGEVINGMGLHVYVF